MKDISDIKNKLYQYCCDFIEKKEHEISGIISSLTNDLYAETKSSAGDKHETGRAMLQLEMEKMSGQLSEISQMKSVLTRISTTNASKIVCLGSIVFTTKGNYYLAVGAGLIKTESEIFYAVSLNSPIGKQLLGKKQGDVISFNHSNILKVC